MRTRSLHSVLLLLLGCAMANADLVLTPRYYNDNGEEAGPDLALGCPYFMRLELDTTAHPESVFYAVFWTVTLPGAVNCTSASPPTTNDFFAGFEGELVFNEVNTGGGMWSCRRQLYPVGGDYGVSNTMAFLGEYGFTPTNVASDIGFDVANMAAWPNIGPPFDLYPWGSLERISLNQNLFNVVAIPEPQTWLLVAVGLAWIGRRLK